MSTTVSNLAPLPTEGLCFPGPPGSYIDFLAARSIAARQARMPARFAASLDKGELGEPLRHVLERFADLSSVDTFRVFDSALAGHLFGWRPSRLDDDVPLEPSHDAKIAWLLSSAVEQGRHSPVIGPAEGESGGKYLYFDSQAAFIKIGKSPVAIMARAGTRRVVCADGIAFTLPLSGPSPAAGIYANGAVIFFARAAGIPLLNGHPMFEGSALPVESARAALDRLTVLQDALALLARVWPAARAFAERWIRGILLLRYDGCSRSHSSVHFPQVLICTAESPTKVAEAICHELSHHRMFLQLESDEVLTNHGDAVHRSPWRSDPRPLRGLLNGVHAFLNVGEFYRRLAECGEVEGRCASDIIATQRGKIQEAWNYVKQQALWTPRGEVVADDLDAAVRRLS